MAGHRLERITEDIKRELTELMRELKDPRITGLLSVVRVSVSGDLSYATVYISAMDGLDSAKNAIKGFDSAKGFLRGEIGRRLKLRKAPELRFVADDSILHSARIAKILDQEIDRTQTEEKEVRNDEF